MYSRMFHFKILHNILYLNKSLKKMQLANCPLCSFCKTTDETIEHIFSDCVHVKKVWNDLRIFLRPETEIGTLDIISAYLGPPQGTDTVVCHIHLIFKIFIYKSRDSGYVSFARLKNRIKSIKDIEFFITYENEKKRKRNATKWAGLAYKI